MLRKSPGFTAVAVLTLALGIGANTAIFTIINSVLLQPLPYKDADRLVILTEKRERPEPSSLSYLNYEDWRDQNRSFSSLAVFRDLKNLNLVTSEGPRVITARQVSANFFSTLAVAPMMGRNFSAADDRPGAAPTVILSYGAWQRHFGSDPSILGGALSISGTSYSIVGVMSPKFTFYRDPDVYIPIGLIRASLTGTRQYRPGLNAVGRLGPGVARPQAQSDMDGIAARLAALYPQANAKRGVSITPIFQDVVGDIGSTLYLLFGAVGLVLLIACVNVANLLLARGSVRQKEIAIRSALGAGHWRVARQLLTESVLLATGGGIVGVIVAACGAKALVAAAPPVLPRSQEIGVDWRVLVFALTVSIVSGVIFGVAPALQALRTDVQDAIKEGGYSSASGRHGVQKVLGVSEVAFALVLLIGAGVTLRSIVKLIGVNPGFDPHNVLSFKISIPPSDFRTGEQVHNFYRQLDVRLRSIPGVEAASMVIGNLPLEGGGPLPFYPAERPKPGPEAMPRAVGYIIGPGYLRVMGLHLLAGRFFGAQDVLNAPHVAVIDNTLAKSVFPGESPIGKHVVVAIFDEPREIIGVVDHVKHWGLDSDDHATVQYQFYIPAEQLPDAIYAGGGPPSLMMVMRSTLPPSSLLSQVEDAVHQLHRNLPLYRIETMSEIVAASISARRFAALLLALFAAVALILAAIGIYGVMACSVTQRTHEIGVRIALGAQPWDIVQIVAGEGGKIALTGIVIGLLASFGLTRRIGNLLFGISATDPLTLACVATVLLGVALVACYVPARRAICVEPMAALHHASLKYGNQAPRRVRVVTAASILKGLSPAIETRDLEKTYVTLRKAVPALQRVSLRVEPGSIFGLIGQNGAGKTTLVKILLGLSTPTGGSATLLGNSPGDPDTRRRVGYLPEEIHLPEYFNAGSFLRYIGRLNGIDSATLNRRIPELLEKVGLAGVRKPVRSYSKGMQQRLGLAQALLNDPQVLILDEPTDGLDPMGRKEARDLLVSLRAAGKTIFLNSHLLSEIELVCDQIVILDKGEVACASKPADFTRGTGEYRVRVRIVNDAVRAAAGAIISAATWVENSLQFTPRDLAQLNALLDHLRRVPVEIESVEPVKLSLEEFFLHVVSGKES